MLHLDRITMRKMSVDDRSYLEREWQGIEVKTFGTSVGCSSTELTEDYLEII